MVSSFDKNEVLPSFNDIFTEGNLLNYQYKIKNLKLLNGNY